MCDAFQVAITASYSGTDVHIVTPRRGTATKLVHEQNTTASVARWPDTINPTTIAHLRFTFS